MRETCGRSSHQDAMLLGDRVTESRSQFRQALVILTGVRKARRTHYPDCWLLAYVIQRVAVPRLMLSQSLRGLKVTFQCNVSSNMSL